MRLLDAPVAQAYFFPVAYVVTGGRSEQQGSGYVAHLRLKRQHPLITLLSVRSPTTSRAPAIFLSPMKGLKSLFKQSNRNKGSLSEATSSHPEKRLGPAQPLDEHRKQERESSSDLPRGPYSHNRQSAPSSHASLTYPSSRPSVQYPASGNGDRSVGATGFAAQSPSLSERDYDTIRDDYRAYMGAISPGSAVSIASTDAERYSLGSDRRLITGNSEMKYNEDIADRNIEHYGSISPLNGSLRSLNSATRAAQYHNGMQQPKYRATDTRDISGD